jgi:hypothetical protein
MHFHFIFILMQIASSVADMGSGFDPGIRIRDGKKSGSGMNVPDSFSENQFLGLKILKFFDAAADPGFGIS